MIQFHCDATLKKGPRNAPELIWKFYNRITDGGTVHVFLSFLGVPFNFRKLKSEGKVQFEC